jgi:hypothetical protein
LRRSCKACPLLTELKNPANVIRITRVTRVVHEFVVHELSELRILLRHHNAGNAHEQKTNFGKKFSHIFSIK